MSFQLGLELKMNQLIKVESLTPMPFQLGSEQVIHY